MRKASESALPLLVVAAFTVTRLAGQESELPSDEMHPGQPIEVYVAPGRATTLQFRTAEKIAAISLASPVVSYKYDKALNQLEITPAVRTGGVETNLNLRIGPDVYIILVEVVNDVRAQFFRNFTLASDHRTDDETGLERARPRVPANIDLIDAAKTLEMAEKDPIFRNSLPTLRIEALGCVYEWNGCLISLVDVAQFIDRDLMVFRVRWINKTDDALYLDARQYGLFVGDQNIPIIARYKVGVGPVIYPGQLETVFLAVQGYRLSRHNEWRLALPPDSTAVGRMASRFAPSVNRGGRP
jgi:hypothetical protein